MTRSRKLVAPLGLLLLGLAACADDAEPDVEPELLGTSDSPLTTAINQIEWCAMPGGGSPACVGCHQPANKCAAPSGTSMPAGVDTSAVVSPVVAATRGIAWNVHLFQRGPDGTLWTREHGRRCTSTPCRACTTREDCATGETCLQERCASPTLSWSEWSKVGSGVAGRPAVASRGPHRLTAVARSPSGRAVTTYWSDTSGAWSTVADFGANIVSDPAIGARDSDGTLFVAAIGPNNRVLNKNFDGSAWSAWSELPALPGTGTPSAPLIPQGVKYAIPTILVEQGGVLYYSQNKSSPGVWSNWQSLRSNAGANPQSAVWTTSGISVFARRNSSLYHQSLHSLATAGWGVAIKGSITSDPTAVSWDPTRIDVFAGGKGNRIVHGAHGWAWQ